MPQAGIEPGLILLTIYLMCSGLITGFVTWHTDSEVQDLNKMHMLLLKLPLFLVESLCVYVMQLLTLNT